MRDQLDLAELRAYLNAELSRDLAKQGMVEAEYYNLYGELPPDAVVFERIVWREDGSPLFVHQNHYAARQ